MSMTIKGANETALYLKNFQKDIYDVLAKEVRSILRRTSASAKSRYPNGAWTVSFGSANRWPAGEVSTAPGSSAGSRRWSEAPPGVRAAIFDQIGRRYTGSNPQVLGTISSLDARYGKPQRFLWPAWLDNREQSMRDIQTAFDRAERDLQRKLDGV